MAACCSRILAEIRGRLVFMRARVFWYVDDARLATYVRY